MKQNDHHHSGELNGDYSPIKTQEKIKKYLTFKDFKGFKKVDDIHDHYTFFQQLGKGSFGEVIKCEHFKGNFDCAVKVIKKKAI